MPIVKESSYYSPWWLKNRHLSTILPSLFRKVEGVNYQRERIATSDDDFIDLDWLKIGSGKLAILMHGLEGSSDRGYMKGMAKYLSQFGWDVVAYNCRGCSGEVNKQPRLYHHGDTDDVNQVIEYINNKYDYNQVALVGFSMGGSLILNYLGNQKHVIPTNIRIAITYSVPCDLKASALELSQKGNGFYRKRFLKKLASKIEEKALQFPEIIDAEGVNKIDSFYDFETKYTAPLHGFKNADAFYEYGSAKHYLSNIQIPTLIVNAANDPMFSEACYPIKEAENLDKVFLEIPKYGGHVGFSKNGLHDNWMEERALNFIGSLNDTL